jgi:hypothetical protein
MRSYVVRALRAAATLMVGIPALLSAQVLPGASVTPYAGYLVTGKWYDGPIGTSLSTTNAAVIGAELGVPLIPGVSLVGNVAHASGDLKIGVPIFGGVRVGTNTMWLYDVALQLGGISGKARGIAPFALGGIGGMRNNISNALLDTRSTNIVYTAGVGVDVGVARGFALRLQAKDYIGRFDAQDAVGFKVRGNLAHNWALSAGLKLAF